MELDILICTINSGIERIDRILQKKNQNVKYIVSHQFTSEEFCKIPESLIRDDVLTSQIPGKGLSRNRNNALQLAGGDIALITDDDVTYLPDAFKIIAVVFKNDPKIDVACFKIKTQEGDYKNYPGKSYQLKKHKHHPVSSIEIAFRIDRVKKLGIRFDERFGLGSEKIPAGEESVFIINCIRKGLKVVYIPEFIVSHSSLSSVQKLSVIDPLRSMISGAYDAYRMPFLAIPKVALRTIKYLPEFASTKQNPFPFIFAGFSGVFHIFTSKKS